ncbi:MAG: hypothetical protein A3G80_05635 [Betaproteobacteria bacterium RIFCSPLOWO2_12_FULL_62_13b]|nr:MAG: hypothetical protein A3G80_05635 [Betaproteobacteria bacterium RIFCSPLOWO2_12_FULL_62_13b]
MSIQLGMGGPRATQVSRGLGALLPLISSASGHSGIFPTLGLAFLGARTLFVAVDKPDYADAKEQEKNPKHDHGEEARLNRRFGLLRMDGTDAKQLKKPDRNSSRNCARSPDWPPWCLVASHRKLLSTEFVRQL